MIDAVLGGDDHAFAELVDRYSPSMMRLALVYAPSPAVAEEIVQETWLSVIRSLGGFERRSSLKTWIFVILTNCARKQAAREKRSIPLSALRRELSEPEPDLDRFFSGHHPRWPDCWSTVVRDWHELPEERLFSREVAAVVEATLIDLPPGQRVVFSLRDIEGWAAEEVCNVLELSDSNQRVLLHRARMKMRRALESYFDQAAS